MTGDVLNKVQEVMKQSELLRATASVRRDGGLALALGDAELRPVHAEEIRHLESQGNTAEDWSRVRVVTGFDWRRIHHSSFFGDVVLGRFDWWVPVTEGRTLRSGIYHATVADCVIGHDALVRDVRLLANYVVGRGALLMDCGRVTCDAKTTFGNGALLPIGIETGGRDLAIYAEIDVEVAATIARCRGQRDLLKRYLEAVADYAAHVSCGRGIIEHDAVIRHTHQVSNTYVGPHARIDSATGVSDSTLLSAQDEGVVIESGAWVRGALLQWGSRASTLALVENSVLTEHSYTERHGKVTNCLLGPNTGVAEGEATASLLGPFVGFHHQALVIATLWPEGKGNISHGTNAGSNHTAKAPDQEFWPGEGTFLGLGVNVKFPTNLIRAPYSIIACGVNLLPQKIEFPFSLVNLPATVPAGVPAGFQEICPGWVLSNNLYTLKRNEWKYSARNRARRTRFAFDVFRPEIVDMMREACRRLEAAPAREVYTKHDIPGLGKNFLLEPQRQAAIRAYRFFILYYALLGLKDAVRDALRDSQPDFRKMLLTHSDCPRWEHQRRIVYDTLGTDIVAGLRLLPGMMEKVARDVERSKAKDDERGPRIIDDYAEVHAPAAQDPFVQQTKAEILRLQIEVSQLIGDLETSRPPWADVRSLRSDVPALAY